MIQPMNNKNAAPSLHKPLNRPLRRGWTTGTCALAAMTAGYQAMMIGTFPNPVTVNLPGGQHPCLALASKKKTKTYVEASIIKDAGDDPDVTHGAEIIVRIERGAENTGLIFKAGIGVGTVTLPGLMLAPGDAAINPSPRRMMKEAIYILAKAYNGPTDLIITISIPNGENIAKKTMNPRLGILGGLSILGTTGIVIPYSCSAWIHSINQGVDVAHAAGITHLCAATGSTSEKTIERLFSPQPLAVIEMGDFAGGLLKYLRKHPLKKITLVGGFAKITKLSQGAVDLHSARSSIDFSQLAETFKSIGGCITDAETVMHANTAKQVLDLSLQLNLKLADRIAQQAARRATELLDHVMDVEIVVIDRNGKVVGRHDE